MTRRLPSLNQLRAFEAAARHESIKLGAEELCVTPAAVGHQIKGLELDLGTALFERKTRKINLTEAGRALSERLGKALDGIEDAVRVVEQRQVRSRDFTPVFVVDTPVFAPFRRRGYVVEYISNETSPKVVRRRFDFIVAKWGLGKTVDLGQSSGSGTE